MRITKPARDTTLSVSSKPEWPALVFETDGAGVHAWQWTISSGSFKKSGRATSDGPTWNAAEAITDRGGLLHVTARAGGKQASAAVKIKGTNPEAGDIKAYLEGKADAELMLKIISQESRNRQFKARGEPLKSFDNGYGLCQVTNPKPSFEEVWNWQRNIDAGLRLFAEKRAKAIEWLTRKDRSYTSTQLDYESVCRWNGGYYHVWDDKAGNWVRRSDVACDSATGNIGWDMTSSDNKDKTPAELRKRDSGGYNAHTKDSKWGYFGVCYADHVLG